MEGKPEYILFDSAPFHGMGEIKRVNGHVSCATGTIDFDGVIDGEMTITIHCGFKSAQAICAAATKALTPQE